MQTNEPITIRRAQNGFIVFGVAHINSTSNFIEDETAVFNTMEYLKHFLDVHFQTPPISAQDAANVIRETNKWGVDKETYEISLKGP